MYVPVPSRIVERIGHKQILINAKLQIGKRSKNRGDWEKAIKEANVRIRL